MARLRTILKVGYPTDLPRTQLPPRVIRHTDTTRRVIGGLLPISILLSAMSERQQVPTVQSWARSVSLIRAASREDRFDVVEEHFVLRRQCRLRRVMARVPQAIALVLAYASA